MAPEGLGNTYINAPSKVPLDFRLLPSSSTEFSCHSALSHPISFTYFLRTTMAAGAALAEERQRDAEFVKVMHGKSAEQRNAFISMLRKDDQAHRIITDEYVKRWETNDKTDDNTKGREKKKSEYMSLVNK